MITMKAPAKINLTLEVLFKRTDGFHEVRSVMQTISLCDRLSFQEGEALEFRSDSPGWIAEKSLVAKAAGLLKESTVCSQGAIITVEKHIPLVSGLGGDSSDAAITLVGLNKLWKLALPQNKLLELANQLGSDVAFFLGGGTALLEGRGEVATALPPPQKTWVVIAVPDIPQKPEKTKQLYESLNPGNYTDGAITRQMAERLREGKELSESLLFNVFEKVVFNKFPKLSAFRGRMLESGATHVHLAGSGPAFFALLKEKNRAEELYARLKAQKIEVYLAETCIPNRNL